MKRGSLTALVGQTHQLERGRRAVAVLPLSLLYKMKFTGLPSVMQSAIESNREADGAG